MTATGHVVFTSLAILVFLAFLVLLGVLGKLAASATRGPVNGERGCLGGCGLFAVILLLGFLGIAGFLALAVTLGGVLAVEHNPIRSIEILPPQPDHRDPRTGRAPLFVRLDVAGGRAEVDGVLDHLRRRFGLDDEVFRTMSIETLADGTRIELAIPVSARDVEDLRRELELWGRGMPGGIRVELRVHGTPR